MLSRVLSDFAYRTLKYFFREQSMRNQINLSKNNLLPKVKYMVIGIRPTVIQIANSLSLQSKKFETVGFNGFTEKLPVGIYDDYASRVIQGRSLSKGEIGCARSHQLSYRLHLDEDWLIFLEDDVEIIGPLSEMEKVLASLSPEPTLVKLEYGASSNISMPFWSKRALAHTYALNKSALEIINDDYSEIWCVADWPIQWIFRVNLKLIGQDVIRLNQEIQSVLHEGRIDEKSKLNPFRNHEEVVHKIVSDELSDFKKPGLISLYRLLRKKRLKNPLFTAFLASKSGLYFISQN